MSFISYAQNFEDVMLWRVLKGVGRGFYVDVGAQDPDVGSVTRAFYDKGWSGINIEPVAQYHEQLCRARPRDVNLRAVCGSDESERRFFEIPDTGLSTLDASIAEPVSGRSPTSGRNTSRVMSISSRSTQKARSTMF